MVDLVKSLPFDSDALLEMHGIRDWTFQYAFAPAGAMGQLLAVE